MTTALTLMHPAQPTRKQAERITQLEMPPQEDWLVPATTPRGRRVWCCRFAVTGLFPRLYGPFASKRKAVRFLDAAISTISESLTEIDTVRDAHSCEGEFQKILWGPLIEHPLLNVQATRASAISTNWKPSLRTAVMKLEEPVRSASER